MSERLDVRRMLLKRGWVERRFGGPLESGTAMWVHVGQGSSSLGVYEHGYEVFGMDFSREIPASVVVAACEASASFAEYRVRVRQEVPR